jgi:hypothetical protein
MAVLKQNSTVLAVLMDAPNLLPLRSKPRQSECLGTQYIPHRIHRRMVGLLQYAELKVFNCVRMQKAHRIQGEEIKQVRMRYLSFTQSKQ